MSTYNMLLDFIILGIVWNFLSPILTFMISVVKGLTFDNASIEKFKIFSEKRMNYKKNVTPKSLIIISYFLILLPFYKVYINLIVVYYLFRYSGVDSIINGCKAAERFTIIKTIDYSKL